jgi:hypothetical protein
MVRPACLLVAGVVSATWSMCHAATWGEFYDGKTIGGIVHMSVPPELARKLRGVAKVANLAIKRNDDPAFQACIAKAGAPWLTNKPGPRRKWEQAAITETSLKALRSCVDKWHDSLHGVVKVLASNKFDPRQVQIDVSQVSIRDTRLRAVLQTALERMPPTVFRVGQSASELDAVLGGGVHGLNQEVTAITRALIDGRRGKAVEAVSKQISASQRTITTLAQATTVVARVAYSKNPEKAEKIARTIGAVVQVGSAVGKPNAINAAQLAAGLLSPASFNSAASMLGMLGVGGPTDPTNAMVHQSLEALRQDVAALHQDMKEEFQQVHREIEQLGQMVSRRLDTLEEQVVSLQNSVEELKGIVSNWSEVFEDYLKMLAEQGFMRSALLCSGRNRFDAVDTVGAFEGCLVDFHLYATSTAALDGITGRKIKAFAGSEPTLIGKLEQISPGVQLGYLSGWVASLPAAQLDTSPISKGRVVNPDVWAMGVDHYLKLIGEAERFKIKLSREVIKNHQEHFQAQYEAGMRAREAIIFLRRDGMGPLIELYKQEAAKVIAGLSKRIVADVANSDLKITVLENRGTYVQGILDSGRYGSEICPELAGKPVDADFRLNYIRPLFLWVNAGPEAGRPWLHVADMQRLCIPYPGSRRDAAEGAKYWHPQEASRPPNHAHPEPNTTYYPHGRRQILSHEEIAKRWSEINRPYLNGTETRKLTPATVAEVNRLFLSSVRREILPEEKDLGLSYKRLTEYKNLLRRNLFLGGREFADDDANAWEIFQRLPGDSWSGIPGSFTVPSLASQTENLENALANALTSELSAAIGGFYGRYAKSKGLESIPSVDARLCALFRYEHFGENYLSKLPKYCRVL